MQQARQRRRSILGVFGFIPAVIALGVGPLLHAEAPAPGRLAGFELSPHWNEQVRTYTFEPEVRIHINAPAPERFDPRKPTRLALYALPNGNTIEWTVGKKLKEGDDWHYNIQHIGAQTRRLREAITDENLVVAYLEAAGRSWPAWRRKHADSSRIIARIVDSVCEPFADGRLSVTLTGHSGGGSFTFGYLNGLERIPDRVTRIGLLDSNYAYNDEEHHGDKLIEWLRRTPSAASGPGGGDRAGSERHVLCVIAYDDRNITLNGKKVVSDTGGTYRATHRMLDRFTKDMKLELTRQGDVEHYRGLDGQVDIRIHLNPENKILHTVLVGEMAGFIHAMTTGSPWMDRVESFGGKASYQKWIAE